MIITRKHLPSPDVPQGHGGGHRAADARRHDAGVRGTGRARLQAPTRLAFTYVPNGITMADWTPAADGAAFEFTRVLKPLEAFRKDTLILSGLAHKNGEALGDGPGDHARAAASYLTGVHPRKTAGADIQNGISVDQIAAQHLADQTRFPSLELGCDDSRTVGNCDSGYSCAYTNSLAWRGPATPMPPETNPRLVFERLFGDIDTSLPPDVRARRLQHRRSILDLVIAQDDDAGRRPRAGRSPQARRVPDVDPRDRTPDRDGRTGPHRTSSRPSTSRPASRCCTPSTST